jgi:hypothetical protein
MQIEGTLAQRVMIADDLEANPTPGCTAGTITCAWDNELHRFFFTGDFIWAEKGRWKAVVLGDSLRGDYLHSLALVRELDFDVLVPWGTAEGYPPIDPVSSESVNRRRIDAIIDRGEAGHNS